MKVTKYNPAKDVFKAQHAGWKDEVLEEERKWIVERDGQEEENRANSEGDGAVNANDKGKGKSKAIDTGPEEEPDVADGEGIECQCCFAEYFFVCISLSLRDGIFTLTSPTGKYGSMSRSPPLLQDLHLSIRINPTRLPFGLTSLHAPLRLQAAFPRIRTPTRPGHQVDGAV